MIRFASQPPAVVFYGPCPEKAAPVLIGVTERGAVCRLAFLQGQSPRRLLKRWKEEWPRAEFREKSFKKMPSDIFLVGTAFQHKVWRALLNIPPGTTLSYGELARRLGKPKAARAVGRALGANPVPLLVPCHRVVASSGLGGFSSGLEIKRRLLRTDRRSAAE